MITRCFISTSTYNTVRMALSHNNYKSILKNNKRYHILRDMQITRKIYPQSDIFLMY